MENSAEIDQIKDRARRIRIHALRMTSQAGSGHPGPSLSIADILAVLYFAEMRVDPQRPDWPERDRLVLSKGHATPGLYSALCEKGFFDENTLFTFRQINSRLQGHADMKAPGVDATTGSLGTGFSQAVGMALAARLDKSPRRVFAILGDGECQEGQIWEAGLAAASFHLDNLAVFIDRNNDQVEGPVDQVMPATNPLPDKWKAFGWYVEEINGHSVEEILAFLGRARLQTGRPSLAVAYTKKGHGVSFMEGKHEFHAKPLNPQQLAQALAELK